MIETQHAPCVLQAVKQFRSGTEMKTYMALTQ
jgi:hypothetical protein